MTYLMLGHLGIPEMLVSLFIILTPFALVFLIGYFIGKSRGRKENR